MHADGKCMQILDAASPNPRRSVSDQVVCECRLTRKRSWSESNCEAEQFQPNRSTTTAPMSPQFSDCGVDFMLVPNDLAFEQVCLRHFSAMTSSALRIPRSQRAFQSVGPPQVKFASSTVTTAASASGMVRNAPISHH